MEDRSLDLEVPAVIQEAPHLADDLAPFDENVANVLIDDEVHVSSPVPNLDVGQTVPLLGERQETLGEERQLRRQDGELTGTRPEHDAFDTDEVPDVEQFVELEIPLRKLVLLGVDLDAAATLVDRQEPGFSERTVRDDPASPHGRSRVTRRALHRISLKTARSQPAACGYTGRRSGMGRSRAPRSSLISQAGLTLADPWFSKVQGHLLWTSDYSSTSFRMLSRIPLTKLGDCWAP